MTKTALSILVAATILTATPAFAVDDLLTQIDAIAPLIADKDVENLGGPESAAELVKTVEGRWFTLNVTVRNWERDDKAGRLQHTMDTRCADDVDIIVNMVALGPDSFRVDQRGPDGEDKGTMEMVPLDPEGRRFTMQVDDAYVLKVYGLENANPIKQQEVLDEMRQLTEAGADIWLPTPDLMVTAMSGEIEVWGRCPA